MDHALMGGVGGTLTILSYGYWIRENGRTDFNFLKTCRLDLAAAYIITSVFGMAMIVISSQIDLDKESCSKLVINLAAKLKEVVGETASLIFLIGAWAAVFSSLLGVWQSVPYMFTDFWQTFTHSSIRTNKDSMFDTKSISYRTYLIGLAVLPMISLAYKFVLIQKIYAVLGSLVIPFISVVLLILNTDKGLKSHKNKLSTNILLVFIIGLFVWLAFL